MRRGRGWSPRPRRGALTDVTPRHDKRARQLDREIRRYREAAVEAIEQLEWCVNYLHRLRKTKLADQLARNRREIIKRARLFQ